jgi:uncharacterized membrane protein
MLGMAILLAMIFCAAVALGGAAVALLVQMRQAAKRALEAQKDVLMERSTPDPEEIDGAN